MTLLPLIKMGSPRLKNWKGNGSLKNIMKPKLIIIMKINGFEYTESEVLEALRKKGYTILPYRTYTETPIHGSGFTKDWYDTKCAVKADQLPSDENIWHNVAIKEFQKEFIKPKLV
jgi:hypothetical protein